jgi:short-subunit dehydrogenase
VIGDIDVQGAQALVDKLAERGLKATAMALDVTSAASVQEVIDRTVRDLGSLDFMINNAGIAMMGEVRDTSLEALRRVIDINVMGVIHGSKLALSTMLGQGHGHIVNIASVTGLYTFPVFAGYSASKHAVVGFSNALRVEAQDLGVRVSVICPQNIMSSMKTKGIPAHGVSDPDFFRKLPGSWMDANHAARRMLSGVAKNEGIIIVPSPARLMWWLYRAQPRVIEMIGRGATSMFRRHRPELPRK